MFQDTRFLFSLANFEFIFDFSVQNQLIALAFLLITAISNLYAISQNRKFECLIGSLYCLSSLTCLFAGDFISMIISLEFMTVFSCIIIFCQRLKLKPVRQYFLTHLFSSGLILVGICLLISATNNITFISLTEAVTNFELPAILILTGCLINAGAIFVNGWVVNCYPTASSSGIIYLISFTTKVTLIIILKLFSGLDILKLFGVSMIIYGLIFALIEKNLKRLICYLTVSQLGFVLAAIAVPSPAIPSPNITFLITSFIFTHILYNGLFVFYFSILEDRYNIKNYRDLKNTQLNIVLLSGFIITVLIYSSILSISSSYIKEELANILDENYITIFVKITTCTILFGLLLESLLSSFPHPFMSFLRPFMSFLRPFMSFPRRQESSKNLKNKSFMIFLDSRFRGNDIRTIIYLSFCLITLCICVFYPIPISYLSSSNISSKLLITVISIFLALIFRKIPKISTENINLDLYQYMEKLIYFSIDKYKETIENKEEKEEYFSVKIICDNFLSKITAWHNGQTSIFILLFLLLIFILTLCHTVA